MAAVIHRHLFFILAIVLECSGQYYTRYNDDSSNRQHDYSSQCPSFVKGSCTCTDFMVDCSHQELSWLPAGIPTTTKYLFLNNNKISAIEASSLIYLSSLEVLDLSSNDLQTLSADIFDSLPSLRQINLANNDWNCNCSLKSLHTRLLAAEASGLSVVDRSSTFCIQRPSVSLLDVSPSDFLPCEVPPVRVGRAVSSPSLTSSYPNWTSVCNKWFRQEDCNNGPLEAASCVFSPDTRVMATVQHQIFSSQRDIGACRDFCFSEAFSYFAYQNSTVNCLCGQEDTSLSCSDCTSDTISSTALNLCGNRYMRVPLALHMLSDIVLTKSSPTTVYTPITITCTGYPNLISSFSWNLGDGAIISSTTGSIRYTYLYPGSFLVSLTMCGSGQCLTAEVTVTVYSNQGQNRLLCPAVGNVSKKAGVNTNVSLASPSEIRWSRTSAAGDKVYAGVCEGRWTQFQDMCIKMETNVKQNFQLASAACQNLGASLLTFSHLDQIEELLQSVYLPSEESFLGAEYDGSEYKWVATNAPATLFRALNLSQTTGNCLAISSTGIIPVSCSSQYGYICHKAPIQCPDGVLLGSSSHCFYTSSDKQTWMVAREQCNNQHAGDLAVLTDKNFGSLITSSLHLKNTSWIGLSAPKLLGHYMWVDGSAPTLDSSWNSNWRAIGVQWPCVALTPSGLWEATDCNQQLPYICEYTLNAVVQTDLYITGTIDVETSITSVQKLSERTALPPSSGLVSVIFPGVWFAREGILYEVNVQLEAYKSDTVLTIMVLRPSCPSGKFLIRPGCRSIFASCGSPAEARNCPLLPSCSSSEVPCPLLNTCINSSVTCSCAGVTPVSVDCSNTDLDSELSFSVVGQAVFDVPAAGGSVSAQFENRLELQPYDIIGFQSNGPSGFLSCRRDSSSNQQQIIFKKGSTSAMRTAAGMKLADYRKLEEQVCMVVALYGVPADLSIPDSIGFVPDADTYTFSAEVIASPALMASCSVTMEQEIGVVKWLHPALTQASPTPVLYVEAGVLETLLVIISSGSNLELKWILSSGQSYSGNLTSSCPSALSALPQCQNPISQLTTPFAFLQFAFPLSGPTSLTVNLGNSLGQSKVIVNVNTIVRIKDLTLYHTSCVNHSACLPVLEAGLTHQFFCEFAAGFVDQYQFKVNGTQISASSLPNASYIFASPGLYFVTVSASNGLETVEALLTVSVKVRAKVQQALLHELSPTYIRVGVDHSFRLTAEVQTNAELNITWLFGDGGYASGTLQLSTTAANISQNYSYSQVGLYTVQVVLIDAFGVIVSLGTNVTVLTPIRRLVIFSSDVVASGTPAEFYVETKTSGYVSTQKQDFGNISYTFNYGDQSSETVYSFLNSTMMHHTYTTNGTYYVSITVANPVSSNTELVDVVVQICPSSVKLSYNGPQNVSAELTFIAEVKEGSDLNYLFDLGNGSLIHQQNPEVKFTYFVAGIYTAVVNVSNRVCKVSDEESVVVMDADTLFVRRMISDKCTAVGVDVEFMVDIVTINVMAVTFDWTFDNLTAETYHGTPSAHHIFNSVGDHTVTVNMSLASGNSRSRSAVICVQEPVDNVTVTGPEQVGFSKTAAATAWFLATPSYATDLAFSWALNGSALPVAGKNVSIQFRKEGLYNISVMAYNEVSEAMAWMVVRVQHIVEDLVVVCQSCIGNRYIGTGDLINLTCTYLGTDVNFTWRGGITTDHKGVFFQFILGVPSTNTVHVNASNLVSTLSTTFVLEAQTQVSGLQVTASAQNVVEGSGVWLMANYSDGTNISYTWNCTGLRVQRSVVSTVMQTFATYGEYLCLVTATNNVSSIRANTSINVLEDIKFLGVHNLTSGNTLYLPVNKPPSVQAECNTKFRVEFTWTVIKAQAVAHVSKGNNLTYIFPSVGSYEINLTASNAISSLTVTIATEAEEEISYLQLKTNSSEVTVGSFVNLTTHTGAGSNMQYEWFINRFPVPAHAGESSFLYCFQTNGTFVITVNVSNYLNSKLSTITIIVQYPINNFSVETLLNFSHPYVMQNQQVYFLGKLATGTDPRFNWTIIEPSLQKMQTNGEMLVLTFSELGVYEIRANVSNLVSQDSQVFTVYVERAITNLTLSMNHSSVATGLPVSFLALVNPLATPVTFEWTIDGHRMTAASFEKSFPDAGVYEIKVTAYNNVSSVTQIRSLLVQVPVTQVEVINCSDVEEAGIPISLQGVAQGSSVAFSWLVQEQLVNISSSRTNWTLVFPSAGFYLVTLVAQNAVSQSVTTCQKHVQARITSMTVSILHPPVDYIFTNQNVTFVVHGDHLQEAQYSWIVVGYPSITTSEPSLMMPFTSAKQFRLEVTAYNAISQKTEVITFTVKELQCDLPVVSPVGSGSRTVLRSASVRFEVYIERKSCSKYLAVHTWQVYDVADCSQALSSSPLPLPSVDTSEPTLILPANRLPTSSDQFCLCFVMGYKNTPVDEQVHYNLTVLSTPLKALILGGGHRVVQGIQSVCLDASISFNPDNPTSSSGMQYSWSCTEISAAGGCFQPLTTSTSKHCVSSFINGVYNISLTVSMGTHVPGSTFQILDVSTSSPGVLEVGILCVSCSASGHYRISSSQHTALSAQCMNCTCPLKYSWTVYEDQSTNTIFLGNKDTSTGTQAANLVVLRNTVLKDGHSYTFTVIMECQDGSRSPGRASITLLPNLPPSGGSCTVTPPSISPLDAVIVACSGWVDQDDLEAILLYEMKVEHDVDSYLLYYGTHETETVYLAPWPGSGSNASQLVVSVIDQDGASAEALRTWITFKAMATGSTNESQHLLSSASAMLPTLMKQGDPIPLLQYSLALTQLLNSASQFHAMSGEEIQAQTLARMAIVLCLTSSVPVSTVQQALQLAYGLNLLTEFSNGYQSSRYSTLILRSLQNIVDVLQSNVQPGLDRDDFAFESIHAAVYHLISTVSYNQDRPSSSSLPSLTDSFPGFLDLSSEFVTIMQSLDTSGTQLDETQRVNIVTDSIGLARSVTVVVLRSMVLDESSIKLKLGDVQVVGSRSTVGKLGKYIEQGNCSFILPDDLFSTMSSSDEVLEVVIMLKDNPFTWGYWNDLSITTSVPSLSFSYGNGSDLRVRDLSTDIRIIMSEKGVKNFSITNNSIVNSEIYDPMSGLQFQTWTLEADTSKKLVFNVQRGESGVTALFMQVRIQTWGSTTNISSQPSVKAFLGAGFEASSDKHTEFKEITESHMSPGVDHRHYTFFVSERDFDSSKKYSITLVNPDVKTAINVSSAMYFVSCQYFDEADSKWATSGCSVSSESIPIATVCNCNHLTVFGGSSLVPISSISFSDLAKLQLGLNPVALTAVSVILILYIALVIGCRYLDHADLRRISMVPLCGKDGLFKYYITVTTGRQIGAGTTAHVGIKLYGKHGKSEAWHLTKASAFQRNSRDDFLIATDKELGSLYKVRLWHDNAGSSPSWYVVQVHVHDLQWDRRNVFPAHTWLSLEEETGKLQKEIQAAGPEELHSFSHVFRASLSNSWAERHMWLSVVERPDHSRFTRVQRASCCVALLYFYMFVSAVWYGLIKDQKEAALPFSWQVFGWEDLIIALVSVTITFPIGLGLIFIFKKSKLQPGIFQHVQRPQSAQTLEIEAMCDMSLYGGSLRTGTPNEDWMNYFERESTAESIPPISSQLRRTTTVNPTRKDQQISSSTTFPGSNRKRQSALVGMFQRTHDLMWNHENILKSWPEKLPSFAEEESSPKASTSSAKNISQKPASSAQRQVKKTIRTTAKKTLKTSTAEKKLAPDKSEAAMDSDEEFMQRLDEIDRDLQKSSVKSKPVKRGSQISSTSGSRKSSTQTGVEDLFDSGDEWTYEDVEPSGKKKGSIDSRSSTQQEHPGMDRRASLTSLLWLRAASMHVPSTAGANTRDGSFFRRDSTFMHRDSIMHSFLMAGKSRTTLSAMLKHHMQVLNGNSEDEGCRLPSFCVYVGYAICVVMSVISIIMVLLYGYNFGPAAAAKWLLSVLITFLVSAFILEPVKVVALALYAAVITKDAEKDMEADAIDIQPRVEANEQIKEVKFRPIGGFALLQAQEEGKKVRRMRKMLRQATAYLLLISALLATAYLYFGSAVYLHGNHIRNTIVHPSDAAENLYDVKTTDLFWDWACQVLTPVLHRQEVAMNEESPILLGPARLRQIRSTLVDCLRNASQKCVGQLTFSEDMASYAIGWDSIGNASWIHSSADQLRTWPKFGRDLLYPGGGYVQELGTTFNQTLNMLQSLRNSHWLDRRSRALFIEWTAYSPASDLTSCVTLLLEFPISGGVLASHSITTHRLLVFFWERFDPLYVCQVLLLLTGLYLLSYSVITAIQQRWQYFCSLGNWLELLCPLMCLTSIGLYLTCVVIATDTFQGFLRNPSSFTNFERNVHLHEVLRCVHAFLLFLLFLQLAVQVRFIRPLHVHVLTLSTASGRLAAASFIFLLLLLIYAQSGYLFFGSIVQGYRSFQSTLLTLFGIMRGSIDFSACLEYRPVFSHFFFYSFYAFVYGLFTALVLAILQDSYKMTRSQMYFKSSLEPQDYEMIEFMLRRFKLWAGFTKPKPAFRRVKFEGLPSLPSRSSSSAASSWRPVSQMSRELSCATPDLAASGMDALDNLLPRWEKFLTLFEAVESLEKQEQLQVGKVQAAVNRWCNQHKQKFKKDGGAKVKRKGAGSGNSNNANDSNQKPPIDPSSKFIRFRNNFQHALSVSSASNKVSALVPTSQLKPLTPSSTHKGPNDVRQELQRSASDQHGHSGVPSLPVRSLSDGQNVKSSSRSRTKSDLPKPMAAPQMDGTVQKDNALPTVPVSSDSPKTLGKDEKAETSHKPPFVSQVPSISLSSRPRPKLSMGLSVREPPNLSVDTSVNDTTKKKAWDN